MKNEMSWKKCRNQGWYNITRLLYKKLLLDVSTGKSHFMRFLLCDFTLTWFKNSHHISNLCDNFQFNSSKHGWSMAILAICSRLARSDVTVMSPLTHMNWLPWWHHHVAHLRSSSTELAISEKHKSTSPSTLPVKIQSKDNWYWRESRCNELTSQGWTNFDVCRNVWLAYSSKHTVLNNADISKESTQCLDNIKCQQSQTGSVYLCSKTTTVLSEWAVTKTRDVSLLHFYCIENKEIYWTEMYVYYKELYIQYIYKLQVCKSIHGIVIYCTGWGC
jgi:hypothetical protein